MKKRKCFISFKTEDLDYKEIIQNNLDVDMIDKSLNEPIDSDDEDYIMRKIRDDYLSDSTVTIHLIGNRSSENLGWEEQKFIKRELKASLYKGDKDIRNGILGVVLPDMDNEVFAGKRTCTICAEPHDVNIVNVNDSTVEKEFSYNYYIPNEKCSHSNDDMYCVLVKWDDFCDEPNKYIEKSFEKREHEISKKVRVYPK